MNWFNKNKREKQIPLYTVVHKAAPQTFLTITLTKEEALEYGKQKIKLSKLDHFKLWCNLRDYNIKDAAIWEEYYDKCVTPEEKNEYLITKVTYKLKDIVAIMRMFGNCIPLGCSFDTPIENDFLSSLISIKNIVDKKETSDGE